MSASGEKPQFAFPVASIIQEYKGSDYYPLPSHVVEQFHTYGDVITERLQVERAAGKVPVSVRSIVRMLDSGTDDEPLRFALTLIDVGHRLVKDFSDEETRYFLDFAATCSITNIGRFIINEDRTRDYFPDRTVDRPSEETIKRGRRIMEFQSKLREVASPTDPQARK